MMIFHHQLLFAVIIMTGRALVSYYSGSFRTDILVLHN